MPSEMLVRFGGAEVRDLEAVRHVHNGCNSEHEDGVGDREVVEEAGVVVQDDVREAHGKHHGRTNRIGPVNQAAIAEDDGILERTTVQDMIELMRLRVVVLGDVIAGRQGQHRLILVSSGNVGTILACVRSVQLLGKWIGCCVLCIGILGCEVADGLGKASAAVDVLCSGLMHETRAEAADKNESECGMLGHGDVLVLVCCLRSTSARW